MLRKLLLSLVLISLCSANLAVAADKGKKSTGKTNTQTINGYQMRDPKVFSAKALEIGPINASGVVSLHDGEDIIVHISGEDADMKSIYAYISKNKLHIKRNNNSGDDVYLRIKIPKKTPIDLSVLGEGDWDIEEVNSSSLKISGCADINIANIDAKKLSIDVKGKANILVSGGSVDQLSVKSTGNSQIELNAKVKDLNALMIGEGVLSVKEISGKINREKVIGKVRIKYKRQS